MKRKLSEILLEIAKTGLSDEKYFGSELMHALVFLAHVAWNRDTKDVDYLKGNQLIENLKSFPQKKRKIQKQLISENWEEILQIMSDYKRHHFSKDKRKITSCGYTPRETFRVEWEK